MAKGNKDEFSNSYRFVEGGKAAAVLDSNGKLTILSPTGGSMEVFQSWKDYVKKEMGDVPVTGDEDDIVEQLSMVLGEAQVIDQKVSGKEAPVKKEGENGMANKTATTKKVAPAKEAKAPREKKEKVIKDCLCGCGGQTGGRFCPGHDAKFHGWAKKIQRGEMKFSEVPATAQKALKAEGVTQGVLEKKEEKATTKKDKAA